MDAPAPITQLARTPHAGHGTCVLNSMAEFAFPPVTPAVLFAQFYLLRGTGTFPFWIHAHYPHHLIVLNL